MKRSTKSITAFILTLLLIIASPAAAFAGTIGGTSDVQDLTINVVLPSDINFVLDPLELDDDGNSQIASANYFFVNQTFAPVKIELEITATTTNNAALASTSSAILGLNDPDITDKLIYFGALGANSISETIVATDAAIATTDAAVSYPAYFGGANAPTGVYASGTAAAVSTTLVPITPASGTTGSAVIGFALAAADESATTEGAIQGLAANNDGAAAFQFYAQLNTYAAWEPGDISVSGNYTLVPMRGETYDSYHALEVGLNQYIVETETPEEPEAPTPVGFIGGASTTTTSITVGSITSGSALAIPFNFGGETVASVKSASGTIVATDQYTVDAINKTFTYSTTRTATLKALTVNTYNTITLSGGGTYIINFVQ